MTTAEVDSTPWGVGYTLCPGYHTPWILYLSDTLPPRYPTIPETTWDQRHSTPRKDLVIGIPYPLCRQTHVKTLPSINFVWGQIWYHDNVLPLSTAASLSRSTNSMYIGGISRELSFLQPCHAHTSSSQSRDVAMISVKSEANRCIPAQTFVNNFE